MQKSFTYLFTLLLLSGILFVSGCAKSYRPILPASADMMTKGEAPGITYGYLLDVLSWTRNAKYAKREVKTGFRVAQIQISNQTDEPIRVREDVRLFIGGDEVKMVEIPMLRQQLKQRSVLYLLYGLIFVPIQTCTGTNCQEVTLPIGLAIAALNIALASNANNSFERDLMYQNLIDKEIDPGETVSGLLGFYSGSMGHLSLKLDR